MVTIEELVGELKSLFPDVTRKEGEALWNVVINTNIVLPSGEKVSGSFRWWAGIIASVYGHGTDYLDFFCSPRDDEIIKRIEKKLYNAGWKIEVELLKCSKCGKTIGRFSVKAFNFKTGEVLCVDCL